MNKFFLNIRKYYKYAIKSAKAELKSEVADSYFNWLWWIIEPISFMLIYTFIFGYVFDNTEPFFSSFVFIGLTAWNFFNRMVSSSVKLIVHNRDLVTKVYIPKYILLLSKSFIYVFKLGISLIIAFILMIFQGVQITWHIILIIPILIILYFVSFGIGLILMNFGVYIDDLSNLTNIVLKIVFYLSGVFYNIRTRLSGLLSFVLLRINPIAFLMDELRKVMLEGRICSFVGLAFWSCMGLILCILGISIIHKNENSYAKVI